MALDSRDQRLTVDLTNRRFIGMVFTAPCTFFHAAERLLKAICIHHCRLFRARQESLIEFAEFNIRIHETSHVKNSTTYLSVLLRWDSRCPTPSAESRAKNEECKTHSTQNKKQKNKIKLMITEHN